MLLPRLFHRDWILNRRVTLLSFGIFGAFQVYSVHGVSSARVWLIFASIYASFLAVAMFVREHRFGATGWGCTLPVTRRELVLARFIESWVVVLAALGGALVLAALLPGSVVRVTDVLQPATLLIGLTVVTLVIALMQPFTIRFGFVGIMIFVVGLQVGGVILLTLSMALGRRGGGTGRPIVDTLSMIGSGVTLVRDALPPALFVLLVVTLLALINWMGYRLAVFLFRRVEL